jgi:hypothetical protein
MKVGTTARFGSYVFFIMLIVSIVIGIYEKLFGG